VDFFEELREIAAAAGVAPSQADALCDLIAQRLGGSRPYIRRRSAEPEIQSGDTPASVRRRYGCSRATADRWVNSWKR
jgi:hypothetical protein